jgi:hypothetical protein
MTVTSAEEGPTADGIGGVAAKNSYVGDQTEAATTEDESAVDRIGAATTEKTAQLDEKAADTRSLASDSALTMDADGGEGEDVVGFERGADAAVRKTGARITDWPALLKTAAKGRNMLLRLNGRSRLVESGDGKFLIEVFDEISRRAAEENRERLEEVAAAQAGAAMKMRCRLNEGGKTGSPAEQSDAQAPSAEELKTRIEQKLNINVEIR